MISKRLSHSRDSVEHPLLSRYLSVGSYGRDRRSTSRLNQKVYITTEDLTAVFAGFSTSKGGLAVYITLCILSGGFAYLVFRWLPRWRVKLIGKPTPLGKCQWIAIEVRSGCFKSKFLCQRRNFHSHINRINGTSSPSIMFIPRPTDALCPLYLLILHVTYMMKTAIRQLLP